VQRIEALVTECETNQLAEQLAAENSKKEAEELERDIAKIAAEMARSAFAFCHPFHPTDSSVRLCSCAGGQNEAAG
jgi:hypothetical protein